MTRPTCEQLARSPELATLALLEAALDVAGLTLATAWPELHEIEMASQHEESRAALEILQLAGDLAAALDRYRLVLAGADARRHDLPF